MEEVTDQYLDLFNEDLEPIPIYLCDNKDLGYGNRVITWARNKLGGSNGGGEYCNLPFVKHIRVSRSIEEPKRTEVIKHEVNHYNSMNSREEIDIIDKSMISAGIIFIVSSLASKKYGFFEAPMVGSGLIMLSLVFFNLFYWEERKADKGTEFEEKEMGRKDYLIIAVAITVLPLRMISPFRAYWQHRDLFKSSLKKLFN